MEQTSRAILTHDVPATSAQGLALEVVLAQRVDMTVTEA